MSMTTLPGSRKRDRRVFRGPLAFCLLVLGAASVSASAAGQDPNADPTPTPTASATASPSETRAPAPSSLEDELFGGTHASPSDAVAPSAAAPLEKTEFGGLLQLRFDYALRDGERRYDEVPIRSPYFIQAWVDARPVERVRAFGQARVRHDPGARPGDRDALGRPLQPTSGTLDQLWVKSDAMRTVFVTAGRQPVKWGVGRIWNPTDFLSIARRDPLALLDERRGSDLVKVQVPFPAQGVNLIAVADLDGARSLEELGAAARVEAVIGRTEVSASGAVRKDRPDLVGADVSTSLGGFDAHVEGALLHGVRAPYWRGPFQVESLEFPYASDRRDEWIPQVVVGFDRGFVHGDNDLVVVGAEYFYNDAGYDDASLYPWLIQRGQFEPFYVGRQYLAAWIALPSPGRWNDVSARLTGVANLSDDSQVARLDLGVRIFGRLDLNAFATGHFGKIGEMRFGLDVPANPGIPGLEEPFKLPAARLEAGLWISTAL